MQRMNFFGNMLSMDLSGVVWRIGNFRSESFYAHRKYTHICFRYNPDWCFEDLIYTVVLNFFLGYHNVIHNFLTWKYRISTIKSVYNVIWRKIQKVRYENDEYSNFSSTYNEFIGKWNRNCVFMWAWSICYILRGQQYFPVYCFQCWTRFIWTALSFIRY